MIAGGRSAPAETDWEQRLLRNAQNPGAFKLEYQELKFTLHRKLLDKINLDALAGIDNDRIRAEVREAVLAMVRGRADPADGRRKAADQRRSAARGLRPGAARAAAAGPRHLRHPGERPQAGVRGAQGNPGADQRALSRRRPPAAHHRQDRVAGGPPGGRIQPHGGCAPDATDRASTPSFLRWRWMARCFPSAASAPTS